MADEHTAEGRLPVVPQGTLPEDKKGSHHFHSGDCYAMGPGDTEALICKWRSEGGMFGRKEAADELEAIARKKWRL